MTPPLRIMINGLPGNMAHEVLTLAENRENQYEIIPFSLTGSETESAVYSGAKQQAITLIPPNQANQFLQELTQKENSLLIVDYTHPTAVTTNVELYCRHGFSFVLGTTGGNREHFPELISNSGVNAVIAPNMAFPIVALQAMVEYAAKQFPDVFSDFHLTITESHQQGKADTSGTAKAMVTHFQELGVDYTVDKIKKIRLPEEQTAMGIPTSNLSGHAYHTYSLTSENCAMDISFTHNVRGRKIYAEGTLRALDWLGKYAGSKGQIFTMQDVLKS